MVAVVEVDVVGCGLLVMIHTVDNDANVVVVVVELFINLLYHANLYYKDL